MSKALIIYHQVKPGTDCPDGVAAAWATRRHLLENESLEESEIDCLGWSYDSGIPDNATIQSHHLIYVVDFSFPAEVLDLWQSWGVSVTIIDHHETAMNMLEGLSAAVFKRFDMAECGATLAWKTFFPGEKVPAFLQYVKDRDLWDFLLPHSQDVHEAVSTMRYGLTSLGANRSQVFELFDGLARLTAPELAVLGLAIGGPKLEPKRKQCRAIAERALLKDVFGHIVPVAELAKDGSEDRLTSDACMVMYRELFSEAEFVACLTSDGSYSLRSDKHKPDGGFHVGNFAKGLKEQGLASNGGGHRNAAGFKPT